MPASVAILLILSPLPLFVGGLYLWVGYFPNKIEIAPVEEPMLRTPGETQRKRINALNERMLKQFTLAVMIPTFMAGAYSQFSRFCSHGSLGAAFFAIAGSAMVTFPAIRIVQMILELRDQRFGYAGKCLVAERLMPLLRTTCYIFHDCPADLHENIDHIVVTPHAVYAIKTVTRRKGLSDETNRYEAHVYFDGNSLTFPHSRERSGLDKALRHAKWLSKLLSKELSDSVNVEPVLALPGWIVRRTGNGDVSVVNPGELPRLIRKPASEHASPERIRRMNQIRFILETRCRDVVFLREPATKNAEKQAGWARPIKNAAASPQKSVESPAPVAA